MNYSDQTIEQLLVEIKKLEQKATKSEELEKNLKASNQQLIANIKRLKDIGPQLEERVKELNCFHKISESVSSREALEDILQDTVNIIPSSWQYPKTTCAKITLQGMEFKSDSYEDSKWKLSSDISVAQKVIGQIEVCYSEQCSKSDIDPFLKEEEKLLHDIAERLGRIIERKNAENELRTANQQLNASDQQLRATNQQLSASDQQLRATIQQLTANEKDLKKEKEFSENLLITANVFILTLDLDANITLFNKFAEKLTGYKKEEVLGKNWFNLFIPEQNGTILSEVFANVLKGMPEVSSYENHILCRNGSERLIHWENTVLKKENGEISGSLGIGTDITERKLGEDKLLKSEEKFRSYIENAPDGVFIVNQEGEFLEINQAACEITGYTENELLELTISELHQQEYLEKARSHFQAVIKDGFAKDELGYLTKTGEKKFWNVDAVKLSDTRFLGFAKDITERKQAEKAIHENEYTLRQIIDLVPLLILAKDQAGKFLIANKTVADIYGTTVENIIGKSDFDFTSNKKEAEKFIKDDLEVIESGQQKDIPEEELTDSQGNLRYLQTTKIPFKTTLSKTPAILAVAVDITARKKIENYLHAALDKAEESDRLKSAFLANMSHEIRTPMNGILGFVDLLDTPGLDITKKHEFKKIIHKSSDRLLNTINALIDISRIEANQIKILNSEVCINKLLEELHVFFNPEANSKGLSLTFSPTFDRFQSTIFIDSCKLNGVLINLIKNAIKYTDTGSITFGYILKDAFIEFFVEDTGIGVPEARQEAIFDRFIQVDGGTRAFEGLGLGLSISKAYVEAMGGEICLNSVEGKGSKFSFTIPHKSSRKKNIKLALDTEENIYTKKKITDLTILIAEDDDVISSYYKVILEDQFRKVLYAKNGQEAIEIFKDNPEISLILMDIKMPLKDGYTATREIRKFNKDVIIIAQTAYAFKGDREAALKAGCDEYMPKPIKREKLLKMIELLIGRRHSES